MGDELNALVVELNALVHELDNVESQSSRIWDDFPELQAKAQLYDLSGLGESGLTKVTAEQGFGICRQRQSEALKAKALKFTNFLPLL